MNWNRKEMLLEIGHGNLIDKSICGMILIWILRKLGYVKMNDIDEVYCYIHLQD